MFSDHWKLSDFKINIYYQEEMNVMGRKEKITELKRNAILCNLKDANKLNLL